MKSPRATRETEFQWLIHWSLSIVSVGEFFTEKVKMTLMEAYSLVNIQKAIENDHL